MKAPYENRLHAVADGVMAVVQAVIRVAGWCRGRLAKAGGS